MVDNDVIFNKHLISFLCFTFSCFITLARSSGIIVALIVLLTCLLWTELCPLPLQIPTLKL